jgi:hypothetical protein
MPPGHGLRISWIRRIGVSGSDKRYGSRAGRIVSRPVDRISVTQGPAVFAGENGILRDRKTEPAIPSCRVTLTGVTWSQHDIDG